MTRWVWVVLAAALVSCGGGESVDPDEDEDYIEDALLRLDDLPDGFEEEPVDDEDENDAADVCNEDVLDLDPDDVDAAKTAETDPVQFQSDTLSIRAQITAFDDGDIPRQLLDALADDADYIDCFVDEFTSEQPADISVEDVDVDDLPIDADAVDAGVTLVVQLDVGGIAAEARQYLALVDRYAVAVDVTARAEEMDTDAAVDALDEMVVRLSDD